MLRTAPLPPVLSPVHVVSDVEADDEDIDEVAVYAVTDEPDDNPPDVAPPKVCRVRRLSSHYLRFRRHSRVRQSSPCHRSDRARKNMVPDFVLRTWSGAPHRRTVAPVLPFE